MKEPLLLFLILLFACETENERPVSFEYKPEIIQLPSNVFPAKVSATTPAGVPKVLIPGGKKYEPPVIVTAIDSPYAAGIPEVITAAAPDVS